MTSTITPSSKAPFSCGPSKGKRLKNCSTAALEWIVAHMTDTDHHAYAVVAKQILADRAATGRKFVAEDDLDAQADEFLRQHGAADLAGRKRKVNSRCSREYPNL
jgi:hypothetical protein